MKVIKINTPNGQYVIPLYKVAEHRAEAYHPKSDVGFIEEVDYVMNDDFEGIDWLLNNTNYEDWEEETIKLNDDVKVSNENFWCSSEGFEIIEM